ncbi:universal stress protein [Patulibacter sp. NPDC049589]|uniref:universal stress protein n=1 Tax=Patulibacter sp. NPDC049589 TaxID=3154731 RepID=UPI003444A396
MHSSILVGTDGSGTAAEAVAAAARLAAAMDARLTIVSAFAPVPRSRLRAEAQQAPSDVEWTVNAREDVEALLETAKAAALGAGATKVRTAAREGDPATGILDVADELHCDLIVVGNRGMTGGGGRRFLLGAVPDKISHHAPCSVLIVATT